MLPCSTLNQTTFQSARLSSQCPNQGGIPLQKWQISHWLYFPSNEDDLSAFYIAVTVTQQKNKGKGGITTLDRKLQLPIQLQPFFPPSRLYILQQR